MANRLLGLYLPPDAPLALGLNLVSHLGVDMCVVNLADANFYDGEGPMELIRRSEEWAPVVCGRVTCQWTQRSLSRIEHELSMASHYGLTGVIIPLPQVSSMLGFGDSSLSMETVAAVLLRHCNASARTKIIVDVVDGSLDYWNCYRELLRALNVDRFDPTEPLEGSSSNAPWSDYFSVRRSRGAHAMINAMLTNITEGDSILTEGIWFGERLSGFVLPSTDDRADHPPTPWHDACVMRLLGARGSPLIDLSRESLDDLVGVEVLDRVGMELSRLNTLYFAQRNEQEDGFMDFEDCLQLPLQPLGDHLPNPTYGVFEADSAKYISYQKAVEAYLEEQCQLMNADRLSRGLRVAVLGAGRGPLVSCVLKAAAAVGNTRSSPAGGTITVHVVIIEKNPHAVEFIRVRQREDPLWVEACTSGSASMEVIEGDGRVVGASLGQRAVVHGGGIDLLVSELLGSLGDNELSPECIEGFMDGYTHQGGGVNVPRPACIPSEYTSMVAPVYSGVLLERVRDLCLKGGVVDHEDPLAVFHTMFVVQPRRHILLAPPSPMMTFRHNGPSCPFEQTRTVTFTAKTSGILHGFLGYFECVLYNEDTVKTGPQSCLLSTSPTTHTEDMYSWFPIFIPLLPQYRVGEDGENAIGSSLSVATGDAISLLLRRCYDSQGVWFEWQARVVRGAVLGISQKMNPNGEFSKIRL